jgi:predicted Rossmann fold nucleotide-binding protein DprA/Smf involved in DNA uptake
VIHPSEAKAKLEKIFDGVFLFTEYSQNCNGRVFLVPKSKWQRNSRGIKNMIRAGATELEKTGNTAFDARFRVFYDQTVNIKNILSARLQENMIKYHDFAKAEVYASFINSDFYLAMHESFDLLDSSLFRSNLSFEKIYGFFRDLQFYLQIVEDIDRS